MAESEEKLKSLLMKVKESEKAGLKLSIQKTKIIASSPIQFSCSVMSNSATPLTTACHASLSITNFQSSPKLMSIESVMPSNYLSHPLIDPFSSCPQSFPASGSFQMSQLFASGGQSTGVSASTSVLPMNTQD